MNLTILSFQPSFTTSLGRAVKVEPHARESHTLGSARFATRVRRPLEFPSGLVGSPAKKFFMSLEDRDQQISDPLSQPCRLRLRDPNGFPLDRDLHLRSDAGVLP